MESSFPVTINGVTRRISGEPSHRSLLAFLRSSGLTAAKEACDRGDCGACSVALLDKDAAGRPAWRAINSCLTLLASLAGRQIITAEGLADGPSLHAVQTQIVRFGGSQCGFCTPGVVISLFEAFHRHDLLSNAQLDQQLAGNLCRCTGYRPIRDAAVASLIDAAESPPIPIPDPDLIPPSQIDFIDPLGGRFFRPVSLSQTLRLLTQYKGARLVAGCTDVAVDINRLSADLPLAISLDSVAELTAISSFPDHFEIGAAATLTNIGEQLGAEVPMLTEILSLFGSRQIRNRATLGGNLATASPVSDLAPVLFALRAHVHLASADGERSVPVHRFITGYRQTCLRDAEIIKSISIPKRDKSAPPALAWCYKVSKRREVDIATVTAAFALEFDGPTISSAILAFGGLAPATARARDAESSLVGRTWDLRTATETASLLSSTFSPISDHRGGADYRRALAGSLFLKFFHGHPDPNMPPSPLSSLTLFRNPAAPAARHHPGES